MILSRRVALGGVQLDEIDPWIVIRSIDPGVTHETVSAVSRMGGFGQRMTGEHWDTLEVKVTFAIDIPKREAARRKSVYDAAMAWAGRRGWLTVNYMTNRRFYVDKVIYPGSGDIWQWTDEYTLTFRAYNVPFWQEETPVQASHDTAASGRVWIQVGGTVRGVLDAVFQNESGMEIPNFSITAGGSSLVLTNIGLGGSEALQISHGTDGLLRITAGGRSVYDRRTGSDDLYVNPGAVAVDFSATRAGRLTVMSYGRFIA